MPKRNLIWVVAIIAAAAATFWAVRKEPVRSGSRELNDFDDVARAYRLIRNHYFHPIEGAELRGGAVNGMVSKLDEFSSYVSQDRFEAFSHRIMGVDGGLGLRLEKVDQAIRVIGPLVNSPAHKAGVLGGDVILKVDGQAVTGMALTTVEDMLAGPIGAPVAIEVQREDNWRTTISVIRDEFPVESVQSLYRDSSGKWSYIIQSRSGIAYIRVKEFVSGTAGRIERVIRLTEGLRGMVLDLRDNPGGMLPEAVATANLFLAEGLIVAAIDSDRTSKRYFAEPVGTLDDFPLVVIIDALTASGAEIVAGALKLHDRAVLVGTRSRGKGAVQTMFPLPGQLGQMNLTTSQLLIGGQEPISRLPGSNQWGIDPHDGQEVTISAEASRRLEAIRIRQEVVEPIHIRSVRARRGAASAPTNWPLDEILAIDTQLARAVELLENSKRMEQILRGASRERIVRPEATGPPARDDEDESAGKYPGHRE